MARREVQVHTHHVQQLDSTYFDQEKADEQEAFKDVNTGIIGIDAYWQRIEDAGGPDLCITARDKHGKDGASYAYPGGTIVSTEDSVSTSYEAVMSELKTREWWTCLGSQAFDACTAKDAQLDFRPSPHVTEVMKIAQKSMFGTLPDSTSLCRRLHMCPCAHVSLNVRGR